MLDADREITTFTQNQTRKSLDTNRMLVLSVMRSIEIIGEAASKVSKEVQDEHKQIPWMEIIAMRNRLIHAYFDVDLDRVWDTIQDDLPQLIVALEKIIPQVPPELTS